MNLKKKKKFDSNCNFYHVSLLIPYPSKFLVVCHCILIFHGIYLPPTTNIFLYCGELISFLGGGARPFSSIKPLMTNHANSLLVENFLFENFWYVQVSIQTLKKVFMVV